MSDKIINRILAVVLIATLFVVGVFTVAQNFVTLAHSALVTYVQYLPDDPNVFDVVSASINSYTTTLNKHLLGKDFFQSLNTTLQLAMGKQLLTYGSNTMVRLKTGQLYDTMEDCDVTGELDKMARMKEYLAEKDIPFLFVYAHTMLYEDDMLPFGVEDYNIKVADDIVNGLRERGIDTLDSREIMDATDLPLSKKVFNTDQHWSIDTAFTVYCETAKWLRDAAGIDVPEEAIDRDNFDTQIYEKHFIGSVGERLDPKYVNPDDFPIITPKYDTSIKRSQSMTGGFVDTEGSFSEAVLNLDELANEPGSDYANCYDVYGYHTETVYYTNENVESGRVLIIKDSYGTPVSSFMSLAAHEVCAIDLRKGRISAEDFVESFEPDAVVIVHCQEMLRGKNYAFVD